MFPRMADLLPEGRSGNVKLTHFEVTETDAKFTALRAAITGRRNEYVPPGKYARLVVGGQMMMTDTEMEKRTNSGVIRHANGHVFIAGLGLGMILHPIAAKPEVTKITVVEKYPDVVRLVGATVPAKVEIVEADIFDWKPAKGTKYDTIYFDIWPEISEDNLPEMTKLHRRFAHFKAPGAWMDSWCRKDLQARRSQRLRNDRW